MTFWLLATLGLLLFQTVLPPMVQYMGQGDVGRNLGIALGPRDEPPPEPVFSARSRRALHNLFESLWFFIPLSLLAIVHGKETDTAILGAQIFFFARIAYLPAYLSGISGIRSTVWTVGSAGLVVILMQIVG